MSGIKAKIKNKFVSRSVSAFNLLPQITTFTIFIWTFSKIKIVNAEICGKKLNARAMGKKNFLFILVLYLEVN